MADNLSRSVDGVTLPAVDYAAMSAAQATANEEMDRYHSDAYSLLP